MFIANLYGCYAYLTAALLSSNASTPHVSVLICPRVLLCYYNLQHTFSILHSYRIRPN